ncbi:MAG: c-type cytochrome biogenesis protein CcsB, partial [Planctomycetota bacterium]
MENLNVKIFDFTMILYGVASLLYGIHLYTKKENMGKSASLVTLVTAVAATAALIIRWIESYKLGIGRVPITNLYESLVFFAWSVVLFYLFIEIKYKTRMFGAFVLPIAFFTMLFANTVESSIQPLVPALQ